MGDQMESDDISSRDMPMEVLTEILTYLPVKSLVRFTCVCKSWLCLIKTDPRFAMRHYLVKTVSSSCSRLVDNVDYIVEYFGQCGRACRSLTNEQVLRLSMYSLTEKKTFRMVKKFEFGPGLVVSVTNFCHGLMCIYVYSESAQGARILLCNPAIREVVALPVSLNVATHGLPRFGLGFDSTRDDYKIVAAHSPAFLSGRHCWLVNVYSVRNGSWHGLHAAAIDSLEQFESLEGEPVLNANGRILNWLGYRKSSTNALKGLVSFDMVDEIFRETPMPECLYPNSSRDHHLLPSSRWQACLCCSSYPSFDLRGDEYFNGIDIWVLNGSCRAADDVGGAGVGDGHGHMTWSKHVSVTFPDQDVVISPLNLWMNDKELFVYVQKQKGSVEEVFHYDLGTQQLKRTGRLGMLVRPDGYTESLVSIKRFRSLYQHEEASLANKDGDSGNKDNIQEEKDDGGSLYFIREVGRRNNDVRWSYRFTLA